MRADHRKNKQAVWLQGEILDEIAAEAVRLDRSISWMVQLSWRLAREHVKRMPSVSAEAPIERHA